MIFDLTKWVLLIATVQVAALAEEPVQVQICELQSNPDAYNHKLVRIRGAISKGFENFTLVDKTCDAWPKIWLEYGGKQGSDTVFCCGQTTARQKNFKIEGIEIPIVDDRKLRDLRSARGGVNAEISGRFFAGSSGFGGLRGFGHLGCCSLLVIQQVLNITR